ncbi:putative Alpha/Beta hydrolase protein [Seiridium cardinale]
MPSIKYLTAAFLGMAGKSSAQRRCKNITIPVTVSAKIPLVKAIRDQLQSTETVTVSGSYSLSATLCDPESGPSEVLQILTYGIGFDRRYWDFPFHNYNYSYGSFALDHNYSTLAWDRLGFALQALTNLVHHGNYSSSGGGYEEIVHVGHCLGSCVTYALHVIDPDISDAIILTGFSQFSDYQPAGLIGLHLVEANLRDRFAYYPPVKMDEGYLIQGDLVALQTDFFTFGTFDPDISEPAYAAVEPVTVGELASAAYMAFANVTSAAPVLIVTGGEHAFP